MENERSASSAKENIQAGSKDLVLMWCYLEAIYACLNVQV